MANMGALGLVRERERGGGGKKLAPAPRPLITYCASPLAAAMIITVAALRIVLAHGSKPT
jgi:hypothetical protein